MLIIGLVQSVLFLAYYITEKKRLFGVEQWSLIYEQTIKIEIKWILSFTTLFTYFYISGKISLLYRQHSTSS